MMPAGRPPAAAPGCRNANATPADDDAAVVTSIDPSEPPSGAPVELRLLVWFGPGLGWRARISGPGLEDREFVSPFELARFVGWPRVKAPPGSGGLR